MNEEKEVKDPQKPTERANVQWDRFLDRQKFRLRFLSLFLRFQVRLGSGAGEGEGRASSPFLRK